MVLTIDLLTLGLENYIFLVVYLIQPEVNVIAPELRPLYKTIPFCVFVNVHGDRFFD